MGLVRIYYGPLVYFYGSIVYYLFRHDVQQAMLITVFVCRLPGVDLEKEAEIMHYVFMLFPTYT
jgi:hypothetical protein